MTPGEVTAFLAKLAIEAGPEVADLVRAAIAGKRPDLIEDPPPPRQDAAIAAEDEDLIRKRWPTPKR